MSAPTANPLGAGGDTTKAAVQIGALLRGEPKGQPAPEAAPPVQEANPQGSQPNPAQPVEVTMLKDPATGRFVKRAEPETAEDNTPEPEAEQAEGEETAETTEPASDSEELADSIEGLAKQLGMEPDELSDHLKATIKINGEERRANLKELIAGYQKGEDYSRKTAEVAAQRKAVEAEAAAYQQQRDHLSSQLQPLVSQLESLVAEDDARIQAAIRDGDIIELERAKIQAEQRRASLDAAKREQGRLEDQRQSEARAKLEREVADNERLLGEKRPEWVKDPERGREAISKIRSYLKAEGVPGEVADSLYDAGSILIAEKAMKWDLLQKDKPGKLNEVKLAPKKFQRAGPAKVTEDPKKQVHRANLNRLRNSGNVKDAAKAIKSAGFLAG